MSATDWVDDPVARARASEQGEHLGDLAWRAYAELVDEWLRDYVVPLCDFWSDHGAPGEPLGVVFSGHIIQATSRQHLAQALAAALRDRPAAT